MSTSRPLLEARHIDVSYDDDAVILGLSITIEQGTLVGLIGPNGAGKTTLLRSMSGQQKPQSGSVCFEGRDAYEHNLEFKRQIGYVHEEPFLYPYLTANDFMWFIAGVRRVSKESIHEMRPFLDAIGLWDVRNKLTSALSMGMRKKLAIATAMLGTPRILFLDEALNGIDMESAYHIKQTLRKFVSGGGTVILATHALDVAEKLCDRYIVLKGGRVIGDLRTRELEGAGSAMRHATFEQYIMNLLSGAEGEGLG